MEKQRRTKEGMYTYSHLDDEFEIKKNFFARQVNSKYILKSTLTPRPMRKDLGGSLPGLQKSRSCSSLDGSTINSQNSVSTYNNYLTVHVSSSLIRI